VVGSGGQSRGPPGIGGTAKDCHRERGEWLAYRAQSLVLSTPRGGCYLRANIWPCERDACFAASGARAFVYGMSHDHNVSFLAVGYLGPG
jgi:hypothetical protein